MATKTSVTPDLSCQHDYIRRFQSANLQMYIGKIINPHTKFYSIHSIGV